MGLIINAGSSVGEPGDGWTWTNTWEEARAEAGRWLTRMHAAGMTDVELLDGAAEHDGRWTFTFRHAVTGITAELQTPGIDNLEAYQRQHVFPPKVYWNGSSISEPELENFAADGFGIVRTFRPGEGTRAAAPEFPGRAEWSELALTGAQLDVLEAVNRLGGHGDPVLRYYQPEGTGPEQRCVAITGDLNRLAWFCAALAVREDREAALPYPFFWLAEQLSLRARPAGGLFWFDGVKAPEDPR